ncbi:MAG: protein kinase [Spirulinaceae cyanobacterium]
MTNLPDFSSQGYEIIRELGRNLEGGRITWLVREINTNQKIVLKQFCFATAGSSWSGFELYEREISLLQGLNHPGIPHYLDSFPTKEGFCLIQEYKNASPLSLTRSFSPEEIKIIAISILEILVYLQNRLPPILHRDIKLENILVDGRLNVYLIDFGLASLESREVSSSSIFKGTPGFIAPEQIRQSTKASDLYSLGATLICLLTGRKSTEIYDLTTEDNPYRFEFEHSLPQLNRRFVIWLEKMVEPSLKNRFADAQEALKHLRGLEIIAIPKIEFSVDKFNFQARNLNQSLRQNIIIQNSVKATNLQGNWSIAAPPHDISTWISITPQKFEQNWVKCQIKVDTSKLLANQTYRRELWLDTNASSDLYIFPLKVVTASLTTETKKAPSQKLLLTYLIAVIAGLLISLAINWTVNLQIIRYAVLSLALPLSLPLFGNVFMFLYFSKEMSWGGTTIGAIIGAALGAVFGAGFGVMFANGLAGDIWTALGAIVGTIFGTSIGPILWFVARDEIKSLRQDFLSRGFSKSLTFSSLLLTITCGLTCGTGLIFGVFNPFILGSLAATSLPLAGLLWYPNWQQKKQINKYYEVEKQTLVKP